MLFNNVDIFDVNILVNLPRENTTVLVLQHTSKQGNTKRNTNILLYHHLIIDLKIKNCRKNAPVYQCFRCVSPSTSNEKKENNPNFYTRIPRPGFSSNYQVTPYLKQIMRPKGVHKNLNKYHNNDIIPWTWNFQ